MTGRIVIFATDPTPVTFYKQIMDARLLCCSLMDKRQSSPKRRIIFQKELKPKYSFTTKNMFLNESSVLDTTTIHTYSNG